ncbi:DNA recombination protein RmuC [Myxococcota bacterium]|nr:DNA recombination protein RmuC [Myxococcota bacterium]
MSPELPTAFTSRPELALALLIGLVAGGLLGAWLTARIQSRLNARLQDRFEALSALALDRTSERFLHLAGERLGLLGRANDASLEKRAAAVEALVRPLHDALARVDTKLQQVETQRQGHHQSLTQHLEHVTRANRLLEQETRNLAQALRTPNARGRWGELQLRRVVELAGMLEHCDFVEQRTIQGSRTPHGSQTLSESESRERPDLIVRLPGNRSIAIDAKAPLLAYLAASEATNDAERDAQLELHARHVRRHLEALAGRAYWSKLPGSPEFVVLFLPGEPFFSSALASDPELIEDGAGKRVLLAGPTTLIALLRAVAHGWQQEEMAENAAAVARIGRELFDRLVGLNEKFGSLGRKLDSAVVAYNEAIASLESRVQVSARRMAELGVAQSVALDALPMVERRARRVSEAEQGVKPEEDGVTRLPVLGA